MEHLCSQAVLLDSSFLENHPIELKNYEPNKILTGRLVIAVGMNSHSLLYMIQSFFYSSFLTTCLD
jgi:hypothetical protein